MKLAVVVIPSMTMLITLFSARVERWKITMPMAMVFAAGALVGWGTSVPIIEAMGNPSAERAVEIVLALLLFLDATQVKKLRRRTTGLLVRLVLLGVSLCLFVATVVAGMMFPQSGSSSASSSPASSCRPTWRPLHACWATGASR